MCTRIRKAGLLVDLNLHGLLVLDLLLLKMHHRLEEEGIQYGERAQED